MSQCDPWKGAKVENHKRSLGTSMGSLDPPHSVEIFLPNYSFKIMLTGRTTRIKLYFKRHFCSLILKIRLTFSVKTCRNKTGD